jgi:ribosome biogenesis protein Nip4
MRLIRRFLRELNSFHEPTKVVRINNRSFTLDSELERVLHQKKSLTYAGRYLGKDRRRFEPSSILLQELINEEATHKIKVDRDTAWLFVCGNDIFEEHLIPIVGDLQLGQYYLVLFNGRCIGYGRYESSAGIKVLKNLFDIGDFIRREQRNEPH